MSTSENAASVRPMAADPERVDLHVVSGFVRPGAKVLDVGCGDGTLLATLQDEKQVEARGIEIAQARVNNCVARGLSVIQGDADNDLAVYPENAFDFAILSQTIQATRNPRIVLESLLRIGRKAIVSIPNFGHWRIRSQLTTGGRMPVNENLPYSWYDTPNIHFCTIRDFTELVAAVDATVERSVTLYGRKGHLPQSTPLAIRNLIGNQAVFLLSGGKT
jgi:methionine biosynthesis protein MetW